MSMQNGPSHGQFQRYRINEVIYPSSFHTNYCLGRNGNSTIDARAVFLQVASNNRLTEENGGCLPKEKHDLQVVWKGSSGKIFNAKMEDLVVVSCGCYTYN